MMLHPGMPTDFPSIERYLALRLIHHAPTIDVGEVHAQKLTHELQQFRELLGVSFSVMVRNNIEGWQHVIKPNLPWAEEHFLERVSGQPLNPPPSHERWPFAVNANATHIHANAFSHSYPERFWPKWANGGRLIPGDGEIFDDTFLKHEGIRFEYGDLNNLLSILRRNPMSRQAYLPVWFPEDLTAADQGERVPCSLGYHFLNRGGTLRCTYYLRSCDFVRFFRDDVYMAGRLLQWVAEKLGIPTGYLTVHIVNLHCFEGDLDKLKKEFQ